MKEPVTIRAAKITGGAILLGAIITGAIYFFNFSTKNERQDVTTSGDMQGVISSFQNTGDIVINYNIPTSVTQEAIQELENKIKQTGEQIELSKKELKLLAESLKDLDQRTSGIEKLPDGRMKIGDIITGHPAIVIEEHNSAVSSYNKGDFQTAFEYSQNAITAFEKTETVESSMSTRHLTEEFVSKLYRLGAIIAQRLRKNELSYEYAQKAVEREKSPINKALLSTTLANLNKFDEALKYINEALEKDPENAEYARLKNTYTQQLNLQPN